MKSYQYLQPRSLEEALSVLQRFGAAARPLLGGTDLMVRIQKGQQELDAVVDLKRVEDIGASIEIAGGGATLGARLVLSDLLGSTPMREHFPALVEAASIVGSIQIRNRATLAGNICNASPAADTVPALMVYAAELTIAGPGGQRRVPLEGFFLGPGRTLCGPAELLVAVHLPIPRAPFGSSFGRLTRRRGVDLATINMACAVDSGGGVCFAFGAAGPTVIVARDGSGELSRPELPRSRQEELLELLIRRTSPISDVRSGREYRRAMLLSIGRRVLEQALRRREAGMG
jgi:CO/xanthine dehydrogenase FAD-binding subunit